MLKEPGWSNSMAREEVCKRCSGEEVAAHRPQHRVRSDVSSAKNGREDGDCRVEKKSAGEGVVEKLGGDVPPLWLEVVEPVADQGGNAQAKPEGRCRLPSNTTRKTDTKRSASKPSKNSPAPGPWPGAAAPRRAPPPPRGGCTFCVRGRRAWEPRCYPTPGRAPPERNPRG